MNSQSLRWLVIVGAGVLVGLILLVGLTVLLANVVYRPMFSPMAPALNPVFPNDYDSNGERIYFTGTSTSDAEVVPVMLGRHTMQQGMMACVNCHGPEGRGGTITMMMDTFTAPDIRYSTLTESEEHQEADEHEAHPVYTDETIKRAITEGLDPAGEPLDWPMPRWQMSDADLDDIVAYLKTLP